ncbi:type II secretion system F family protein [Candidatus Woesearchaeota archaeon]|nr:type II secretion system F family protein [Candidatus Woesearchaeota archaeon]
MNEQTLIHAIERAGWHTDRLKVSKRVFISAVYANVLVALYFVYRFSVVEHYPLTTTAITVAIIWIVAFMLVLFLCWLALYVVLDLQAYHRRINVEDVLPDYLQLVAANLRAGMTVDRALWYAVRPRFGVLADEIQVVAKQVMTGENLGTALRAFAHRYDSPLLHRAVSLLIEGMEAGGDLADIINKVATTIQETRILGKEMAANVLTYVIFIGAAVMFAAPVLLALAQQLLTTLALVTSSISLPPGVQGTTLFALTSVSIKPEDFQTFAILMLTITSFFSALMIAIIQKGTVQSGIKYIPLFITVALIVYAIALNVLGSAIHVLV